MLLLAISGCAHDIPLSPLDPAATPGPDELLRRIVAVARSGAVRDPAISERLLGLQWRGELRNPAGPISLSVRSGPPWLGREGAYLAAARPGTPPSEPVRPVARVLLTLSLDAQTACIPADQVLRDFRSQGEWRYTMIMDAGFYSYFVVRPGAPEAGETSFIFTAPHPSLFPGPPGCVAQVSVAQECTASRCDDRLPSGRPNTRVFGPRD